MGGLLSVNGVRGNTAILPVLASPGPWVEVARLIADQDSEAAVASVICHGPAPAPPATGWGTTQIVRVGGRLEWGVEGASAEAEFDWIRGTRLVVPASYVRVSARWEGGPIPAAPTDIQAEVGVFAASLPPAGIVGPQRTVYPASAIPPEGTGPAAVLPVPLFAHTVSFLWTPLGNTFRAEYLDSSGVVIGAHNSPILTLGAQSYPIPNGCATVRIVNTSAVNITAFQAIFRLAL